MLLTACIMTGCDYLPNLKGIGFKTAYKLINEHRNYLNVLYLIKRESKIEIPQEYESEFEKAFI